MDSTIQNSKQNLLLMDIELDRVLECTDGLGEEIKDGQIFSRKEKKEILQELKEQGITIRSQLGREWVFSRVSSKRREGVLVSVVNENRTVQDNDIRLQLSEELNVVLKKEIAEHKQTKNDLRGQKAKLKAIFESTALFIWTLNDKYEIISYNEKFKENMINWFEKEIGSGTIFFEKPYKENEKAAKLFDRHLEGAFKGQQQHFDLELMIANGSYVWIELFMEPIYSDEGKVHEVSLMSFETTEKKEVEEEIAASLEEKETLLQEVHHRVKNNLQIISSILNLQSTYVKDENSLSILKESQNRIKSMSYIHENIYLSKNFSTVALDHYVNGLVRNLIHSYSLEPDLVEMEFDMESVHLVLDQAIPCGLIVNEVISNSLKYAFPVGQKGKLKVVLSEKDGRVTLNIGDNGIGMGEEIDVEGCETLGLQLIFTLTEQLDGEIRYDGKNGTEYLITFDKVDQKRLWPERAY